MNHRATKLVAPGLAGESEARPLEILPSWRWSPGTRLRRAVPKSGHVGWKVPALFLVGAAPFLLHLWDGKGSTRLSFEHAYAVAAEDSSPENLIHSAWGRLSALGEEAFAVLHELRRRRTGFDPAVQTVLNRLGALLDGQQVERMRRPNRLSFSESLLGIRDPKSGRMHVQACLDILAFNLEETIRGLHTWKKKGGEPGEAAASTLSWFRWFLKGH